MALISVANFNYFQMAFFQKMKHNSIFGHYLGRVGNTCSDEKYRYRTFWMISWTSFYLTTIFANYFESLSPCVNFELIYAFINEMIQNRTATRFAKDARSNVLNAGLYPEPIQYRFSNHYPVFY